jgi:hypothetical protein
LIEIRWESLDEASVKEIEAKWAAESEDGSTLSIGANWRPWMDRLRFEIFVHRSGNEALSLYVRLAQRAHCSRRAFLCSVIPTKLAKFGLSLTIFMNR